MVAAVSTGGAKTCLLSYARCSREAVPAAATTTIVRGPRAVINAHQRRVHI